MKALLSVVAAGVVLACGAGASTGDDTPEPGPSGLPSCGTATGVFTISPVAFGDLLGWVPLGNLNPPGHLFPTDHQYLYINNPGSPSTVRQVDVFAPGNITITRAHRTHYSVSNTDDYALDFSPCKEIFANFGHVTTITPALLQQMGAFDQECSSYTLGTGEVFSNCFTRSFAIVLDAGALIGTTGGQGTSFALDFGLHDSRATPIAFANPGRWFANQNGNDVFHTVAASEYFAEPVRGTIGSKLGAFNGSVHRTVEPVGGTIAYDVPGAMQGIWFNTTQPTFPEGPHLAVVLDAVDPSRAVISMGTSQPQFPSGIYAFTPATTGFVNRRPSQITADGNIYCFEFPGSLGIILVRLQDATTLRVEGRTGPATCTQSQPWVFGANAFTYVR